MSSRFRRSPDSKAPVKGLSQLGKLVNEARAAAPVSAPVSTAFGIKPEDDDLTCVWKVMADNKPRTATELTADLAPFPDQTHPDDIEGLLRILVTNGFATRQPNRNEEDIYTLKKGMVISMLNDQQNHHKNKGQRGPQSQLEGLSGDGKIDLSEGIMVCLWKVVSDCKSRSQNQILDILGAYGINREVAKNAFVKAKVNHKWFDWVGNADAMVFKMKKHIKMPKIERCDPAELKNKLSPGGIRINNITQIAPSPVPVTLPKAARYQYEQKEELNMAEESTPPAPVVVTVTPPVTKEDYLEKAIWKVMSDHRGYTAGEVGVLLEEFGHNPATVRVKMSSLFLKEPHWFTRVSQKNAKNQSEYVYTLKEEIKMPGTERDEVPVSPPVEVQPTLDLQPAPEPVIEAPVVTETPVEKEETTMAATQSLIPIDPVNPAVAAPLFEITTKIRGREYTLSQVQQLKTELTLAGFGEKGESSMPEFTMLELLVKIGGEVFTVAEANELAIEINKRLN